MDPQAAWDQLLCAYAEGDWDVIEQRATDLLAWLDNGGFPPQVLRQNLGPHWNRALARAGCLIALEIIRSEWSIPQQPA
ncbi:MAG: hypothetical protein U0793_20060 [Gemmataceae bacterium]